MTEVDSGVPEGARVTAATSAGANLNFEAVVAPDGRLTELRCASLDEGARSLLSEFEGPISVRGSGGKGPLDLKAWAEVLQSGVVRERELVLGTGRSTRRFTATLRRKGTELALQLHEVPAKQGRRCFSVHQRRSPLRSEPPTTRMATPSVETSSVETSSASVPASGRSPAQPSPKKAPVEPAIWEWFPDSQVGAWSQGAEALLGVERSGLDPSPEWLGLRIDPLDRQAVTESLARALHTGGGFSLHFRPGGLAPPGKPLTLAGRVSPVEGRGPRLVAVLAEAPAAIESDASLEREMMLREVAREVVWEWDAQTGQLNWGETLRSVLGWDQAVARGLEWWRQAIHPDDRTRVFESFGQATHSDARLWSEEYRIACADGTYAPVRDRGYLVRDQDGNLVHVVGCIANLTEERAEEEARQQESRFRERFVGILGHDLRTPLNAISLSAQTLRRRTTLTETQREVVGRIQSSTARMERMITEILDLTRARLAGGIPVRPSECDVHALSRRVLKELQAVHPDRAFSFEVQGPGGALVDAERLEQAVGNLLSNACQHSPAGLPIEVESHVTEATWSLMVHNWGPPIAPERLSEIFHPFRSGGVQASQRLGPGLGLGLFIVQEIAQSHGGCVTVSSNAEEGTRFVLTLPTHARTTPAREGASAGPAQQQGAVP